MLLSGRQFCVYNCLNLQFITSAAFLFLFLRIKLRSGLSITACLQDFYLIERALSQICEIAFVENEKTFFKMLKNKNIRFVTIDPEAKNLNIIKVIDSLYSDYSHIRIFIISRLVNAGIFENFLNFKPDGYFLISYNLEELRVQVKSLLQEKNLSEFYDSEKKILYENIIGISPSIKSLRKFILKASRQNCPVIIYGETGCGKDIAANMIHLLSEFKGSYVPVNVSCFPDELAESMLFGTKRGAFTGAITKEGLLSAANNGTLFLDEIQDLSLSIQPKLLRAIETGLIRPLGGNEEIPVNFRLICAANRSIKKMIKNNLFRADLFYRIDVMRFKIEPLRKRPEDIPLLAQYYCKKNNKILSSQAEHKLLFNKWKGNVRELFNCLYRAQINAYPQKIIKEYHIEF